jgi:hypothetical protein
LRPQDFKLLIFQLNHEIRRESLEIPANLLVEAFRRDTIEKRKVGIEHHPQSADCV